MVPELFVNDFHEFLFFNAGIDFSACLLAYLLS